MLTSYGETMHSSRNPFAYPRPITLGNLEDLFAHHRSRLAGWTMEGEGGSGGDGGGSGGGSGGGAGDDGKGGKDYTPPATQEDLNRIIGERVARERAKFADYDDLKKKADAHDKALDEARTEQEKAVEAARKDGETAALEKANTRLVSAEARAIAAEEKFLNPSAAVKLLELGEVKVGDDGSVDADAIRAKLKDLADSDPYLIGEKPKPKPDKSQGGGDGEDKPSVARGREMFESRKGKKAS